MKRESGPGRAASTDDQRTKDTTAEPAAWADVAYEVWAEVPA